MNITGLCLVNRVIYNKDKFNIEHFFLQAIDIVFCFHFIGDRRWLLPFSSTVQRHTDLLFFLSLFCFYLYYFHSLVSFLFLPSWFFFFLFFFLSSSLPLLCSPLFFFQLSKFPPSVPSSLPLSHLPPHNHSSSKTSPASVIYKGRGEVAILSCPSTG